MLNLMDHHIQSELFFIAMTQSYESYLNNKDKSLLNILLHLEHEAQLEQLCHLL